MHTTMTPSIKISDNAKSIRVRVGSTLLVMSGDAFGMLDVGAMEREIRSLDNENAICVLLGLGFEQLGTARKKRESMRVRCAS